jgi:hypothetical protein
MLRPCSFWIELLFMSRLPIRRILLVFAGLCIAALLVMFVLLYIPPSRPLTVTGSSDSLGGVIAYVFTKPTSRSLWNSLTGGGAIWNTERMCIGIEQKLLWQYPDDADTLSQAIRNSLSVTLDDTILTTDQYVIEEDLTVVQHLNPQGTEAGTSYDIMGVCIPTDHLSEGGHNASVTFNATDGIQKRFEWQFVIGSS